MATTLLSFQEFATSPYADMADQVDNIEVIIEAAEDAIQKDLGRVFAATSYTEIAEPRKRRIFLKERPVISLTSVKRRASYTAAWEDLDLADFRVDTGAGVVTSLNDAIADTEVEVVYQAGYSTIPAGLKQAVARMTVILAYQDFEVFGAGDAKEPAIKHLTKEVEMLLAPYRKLKMR